MSEEVRNFTFSQTYNLQIHLSASGRMVTSLIICASILVIHYAGTFRMAHVTNAEPFKMAAEAPAGYVRSSWLQVPF